ncbi:isochorismatase family protein [Bacillus atrophaeus]|uniref:isochorismatase family protein n=1 Tax=Bacillus atrophaeus TaxID=1452 RepID=UPI00215A0414|nr:isochorismatase family protein [Bacillus atrophaeus]MCY8972507.1 isochorismatase family protein [Bacillus atrophaeus]MED4803295.1 isochorismatase family protein [Bacillus atrophaeus]MED4815067.1 isochorismatase family protein [Bacillus atrophaeus]MED4824527.1 isochorismatase family protein [Bacillus atrophaeus]MED4843313.1 isochorismatase family protein [Bacillus atrophaeus]
MNTSLNINFQKTALALIDLQKGIVPVDQSGKVVPNGFVKVAFRDGTEALKPETDAPQQASGEQPPDWAEFVPEIGEKENDYTVTKRRWGAFFGTDLDLQLRRRGIDTNVLCGIAANIGVESTAREAFQLGYQQIVITDAMAAFSAEQHESTLRFIFPRIGETRTTEEFLTQVR